MDEFGLSPATQRLVDLIDRSVTTNPAENWPNGSLELNGSHYRLTDPDSTDTEEFIGAVREALVEAQEAFGTVVEQLHPAQGEIQFRDIEPLFATGDGEETTRRLVAYAYLLDLADVITPETAKLTGLTAAAAWQDGFCWVRPTGELADALYDVFVASTAIDVTSEPESAD